MSLSIEANRPQESIPGHFQIVSDLEEIQHLLKCDRSTAQSLLCVDRGPKGSAMRTTGLYACVDGKEGYRLTEEGFQSSPEKISAIDLEYRAQNPLRMSKPPALSIAATWDSTRYESGDQNNILGDNGRLELPGDLISIPAVIATDDALAYYGAVLISPADTMLFPEEKFPIWKMEIEEGYIEEFLLQKEGGGYYLEYHLDKPHFHMPLNGSGYYLLAKWSDEQQTILEITAFEIPDKYAVYTKKGAIHCDAALKGDFLVGYTTSEHCSTVLLRDPEDRFVRIEFQKTQI